MAKDAGKAAGLLKKACEGGHAQSCLDLGEMHRAGEGDRQGRGEDAALLAEGLRRHERRGLRSHRPALPRREGRAARPHPRHGRPPEGLRRRRPPRVSHTGLDVRGRGRPVQGPGEGGQPLRESVRGRRRRRLRPPGRAHTRRAGGGPRPGQGGRVLHQGLRRRVAAGLLRAGVGQRARPGPSAQHRGPTRSTPRPATAERLAAATAWPSSIAMASASPRTCRGRWRCGRRAATATPPGLASSWVSSMPPARARPATSPRPAPSTARPARAVTSGAA